MGDRIMDGFLRRIENSTILGRQAGDNKLRNNLFQATDAQTHNSLTQICFPELGETLLIQWPGSSRYSFENSPPGNDHSGRALLVRN